MRAEEKRSFHDIDLLKWKIMVNEIYSRGTSGNLLMNYSFL